MRFREYVYAFVYITLLWHLFLFNVGQAASVNSSLNSGIIPTNRLLCADAGNYIAPKNDRLPRSNDERSIESSRAYGDEIHTPDPVYLLDPN